MNTKINIKTITIPIDKYQELSGCNSTFEGSSIWDDEHGLEITTNNNSGDYKFRFKIVDPHKFFLAQIKYGL